MGTLLKIAYRNVLRHKRRTAITGVVMSVGIGLFIAADSMLVGMDRLTIDNMVDYTESFLKARSPEYVANLAGTPLEHGVPAPEAAAEALMAADPRIKAVTPRTRFVARASNYSDEIPVLATAVDPERDAAVFRTAGSVGAGRWLGPGAERGVVLGSGLAKELGLGLGDYVLVAASTVYENVNADEYEIVGLVETPIPEINKGALYISYADAEELLGLGGLVTELCASAERPPTLSALLESSAEASAKAGAALPGLKVDSIGELAKGYLAMRQMKGKFSQILIFVLLLIAAVGIVNTILMSVYSRIREIGVLRAYGMRPGEIRRLFTIEGLLVGLVGSLAGLALGLALDWYLVSVGIPMEAMLGDIDMGGIPLAGTLRGEWNPGTAAFGFVFGILVAFLSARIPARRAARLEVTDALRFV